MNAIKIIINIALRTNDTELMARTYDKYITWTDSVKALTAQKELNALKKKYNESLTIIRKRRLSFHPNSTSSPVFASWQPF